MTIKDIKRELITLGCMAINKGICDEDETKALKLAVKSLEAWESVKQEIKLSCIFVTYVVKDRTAEGIAGIIDDVLKQAKEQFLDIIDNHLEELEVSE